MGYVPWRSALPSGLPPEEYEEDLRRLRASAYREYRRLLIVIALSVVTLWLAVWAAVRAM